MCEINPKHSAFFRIEAFTSDAHMSKAIFYGEVLHRLLEMEMELNKDGRFRFHIHTIGDEGIEL